MDHESGQTKFSHIVLAVAVRPPHTGMLSPVIITALPNPITIQLVKVKAHDT